MKLPAGKAVQTGLSLTVDRTLIKVRRPFCNLLTALFQRIIYKTIVSGLGNYVNGQREL